MILPRRIHVEVVNRLHRRSVVALLGPRQCGKSTLARIIVREIPNTVFLDLELPSDRAKLREPEYFFSLHRENLICLDEIQRVPELFPIMRALVDQDRRAGRFFVLGSASRDLIRQTSETLAGRIAYLELTPFLLDEVGDLSLSRLWTRGGFPESYLADTDASSSEWRMDFMRTFLERDIPQLGFRYPSENLDRFWRMCAHNHGHMVNHSQLGNSLGVSHHTARGYMELLANTFMVRILRPLHVNLKKRLVKTPKVYLRDSGILHSLLSLDSMDAMLGHPMFGSLWEGFALEQIVPRLPSGTNVNFYRSATGDEIDLVIESGNDRFGIEFKVGRSPQLSRGFHRACDDLDIKQAWVVAHVDTVYSYDRRISVCPLWELQNQLTRHGVKISSPACCFDPTGGTLNK